MSGMVERVAEAVCEADGCLWSEASELDKGLYRDTARAAIAAMREPTQDRLERELGYIIRLGVADNKTSEQIARDVLGLLQGRQSK